MTRIPATTEPASIYRLAVNARNLALTPEKYFRLCRDNPELRFELTAEKELIVMSPTGGRNGARNTDVTRQLATWAIGDATGVVFDSSTEFQLPNGAFRSPDVSWVRRDRWDTLSDEEQETFPPICPDFLIEIRSRSDSPSELVAKMEEYISNGAKLAWLIDPYARKTYIYRAGEAPAELDEPRSVSGDSVLPRFVLDLASIWP